MRWVVTVLLALLVVVVVAAPGAAVEAGGLRVDPVESTPRGDGAALTPALPPGASASYTLTVTNLHDQPVTVLAYGADVREGDVASGDDNTAVGRWIRPAAATFPLGAGETQELRVDVTRPPDDEVGGIGAIVLQLAEASRAQLGLASTERAALLVEVTADPAGHGVLVEELTAERTGGLGAGELRVRLALVAPGVEEVAVDGVVVLDGAAVPTTVAAVPRTAVGPSGTEAEVVLALPWWGAWGEVEVEVAQPGLVVSPPALPVRAIAPAVWLVLLAGGVVGALWVRRRAAPAAPDADVVADDAHDDATEDDAGDGVTEDDATP